MHYHHVNCLPLAFCTREASKFIVAAFFFMVASELLTGDWQCELHGCLLAIDLGIFGFYIDN
jgi:hypothetical protein